MNLKQVTCPRKFHGQVFCAVNPAERKAYYEEKDFKAEQESERIRDEEIP